MRDRNIFLISLKPSVIGTSSSEQGLDGRLLRFLRTCDCPTSLLLSLLASESNLSRGCLEVVLPSDQITILTMLTNKTIRICDSYRLTFLISWTMVQKPYHRRWRISLVIRKVKITESCHPSCLFIIGIPLCHEAIMLLLMRNDRKGVWLSLDWASEFSYGSSSKINSLSSLWLCSFKKNSAYSQENVLWQRQWHLGKEKKRAWRYYQIHLAYNNYHRYMHCNDFSRQSSWQ